MEPTRCLLSVRDSRSLLAPLGESKRIKYTCIASSTHYVALGANTGGVYCFNRDGYRYIRILANKEGGVSHLRFSPLSENILAAVTGGGFVALWELNLHEQGESKRFHVSPLLKDSLIRDVVWDSRGSRLFYGDEVGRVGVAYIPKQKLFKKPDEICLIEKSAIVQLDYYHEILLVSTQQRCLLFRPSTREVVQVGKKTRDGLFGACFHHRWPDRPPVVYSARPGGRLWEADIEGTVLSTLKLKDLVVDVPKASPIFGVGFQPDLEKCSQHPQPRHLHFPYLFVLHNTYMVGVADHTLFLFNPASYKLAARSCDLGTIQDMFCDGHQLFVVCESGRTVKVVDFMDLGTCVCELVKQSLFDQAVLVMDWFSSEVQHALFHDGALYKAIKTALASTGVKMSQNVLAVQSTLEQMKEKFETDSDDHDDHDETTSQDQVDQEIKSGVEEVDGDGYQTIDLNAYSNSNLIPVDTGDTSDTEEIKTEPTLSNGLDVDTKVDEPDLDSTLIAGDHNDTGDTGDHNDTGDHSNAAELSDVEIDPLATSDQAHLTVQQSAESSHSVSPIIEDLDQIESRDVKDDQLLTQTDILTQSDHAVETDSVNEPTRSKSKAIPPRSKSASQRNENIEQETHSTSSLSGASLTSATPSSVGGHTRISLSEPHSLERQNELSIGSPISLGGSLNLLSGTATRSKGKSDFTQRVETALNKQLSVSSVTSVEGEDDLIAIPVSKGATVGASGGGGESTGGTSGGGGKGKKRKSRRKKNPAPLARRMSSPEIRDTSHTKTPSPGRSSSLHHILEEETLPFPEAGLPPTPPSRGSHPHTPHSSEPTSLSASPYPSLPSTPPRHSQTLADFTQLGKNASALFSKVKTLTTQFAEKVETQQTQKQVKNVVKDIFSSLANPHQYGHGGVVSTGSHDTSMMSSQHVFQNSGFALPVSPSSEPEMGQFAAVGSPRSASSDQSDGRISAPMSPPPALTSIGGVAESCDPRLIEFSDTTMEAMRSLEVPEVMCFPEEITSLLSKWIQNLESLAVHLTSSFPCSTPFLPAALTEDDNHRTNQQQRNIRDKPPSCEEISKSFSGPLYQSLSSVVKATVTELASLCAEMEVYCSERVMEEPSSGQREREERETDGDGAAREEIKTKDVSSKERTELLKADTPQPSKTASPSREPKEERETDTAIDKEATGHGDDGEGSGASSTAILKRCSCLVEFVKCYGPVLDRVRMKQLLCSRQWRERKTCLTALNLAKPVDHGMLSPSGEERDLGGEELTKMAAKPELFLEHSIKNYPTLLPWEVAVVCGVDQWDSAPDESCDSGVKSCDHVEQSDSSLHSLYADYIDRLFSEAKESERTNAQLASMFRSDSELLLNTLSVLLRLDGRGHQEATPPTDCTAPRAWSHMTSHQVHRDSLERLVGILVSMETNEHLGSGRKLCQNYGYWVGVVRLSVAMGDKRTALHTMLKLRDKRLFSSEQKWGNLLKKTEDWELLMEIVNDLDPPLPDRESADSAENTTATMATSSSQIDQDRSSRDISTDQLMLERVSASQLVSTSTTNDGDKSRRDCRCLPVRGEDLTQTALLKLMLRSLPPLVVNKLLSGCHGNSFGGKTQEQLHSLLSKLTSIHAQQRALSHSMLERVDSYLWSQRSSAAGPQIVAVQNAEKQSHEQDKGRGPGSGTLMTSVPPTSRTMEDASTHWGVVVGHSPESGGHCPVCILPLTKSVSDLQPGLLVFPCGHAFHKLCLPEQACLVCFNKNCQRLLATYLAGQA